MSITLHKMNAAYLGLLIKQLEATLSSNFKFDHRITHTVPHVLQRHCDGMLYTTGPAVWTYDLSEAKGFLDTGITQEVLGGTLVTYDIARSRIHSKIMDQINELQTLRGKRCVYMT